LDARLHDVCRDLPPLDRCELRFVSSEVGFAKPDPRFFAAIAERLSASPQELLLVGDDPRCDYEPALAAGWQALQIDRQASHAAPGVIGDLRELLPLLAR
jgi:putative hydrolase of the HAD superfamily